MELAAAIKGRRSIRKFKSQDVPKSVITEILEVARWRKFTCQEIVSRDKTSLDIIWLKDKSLADLDNLPDPDVLANDIIENLESAAASFKEIMITINGKE